MIGPRMPVSCEIPVPTEVEYHGKHKEIIPIGKTADYDGAKID
jgi:hypothetical protein